MKKYVLILGGSSSIAQELMKLHKDDILYFSHHKTNDQVKKSFYLNMNDESTYRNIPDIEYDIFYSFLGYTPSPAQIDDPEISKSTIERNFLYPTLLLLHILKNRRFKNCAKIKIVTSVAGIRGRKLNFVYGASKAGIQKIIEGLANKYPMVKFTDIVLGPVYTSAVPHHNSPSFLIGKPVSVAKQIFIASRQKVYIPYKWKFIMAVIRLIPNFIYNKLSL
jgi:NAD(P)-dependent dehydrogenase (short-subunit alcohol dehydrogenase family)